MNNMNNIGQMNQMQPMNSNIGAHLATIMNGGQRSGLNTVVLLSNLKEEVVTPHVLFTLCGVYGDVVRVKILYNKKSNALVQVQLF